jgi:hypothetical protein
MTTRATGPWPLLALAVMVSGAMAAGRRWMTRWGSTADERLRALPGDGIVPGAIQTTRAITIAAPPEAVWPWLVQMGQDRAGFYSHDRLERLAGADIHNAERIVPAWQRLKPGDLMRTYRYIRRFEPLGWIVETVDPPRALVVRSVPGTWSWALVLAPTGDGPARLVARERKRTPWWWRPFDLVIYEPAHFIMEAGVLHGIRDRAEGRRAGDSAG